MENTEFKIDKDKVVGLTSKELNLNPKTISVVIELREEGSTVPFIARYRKDRTGGLDEVEIRSIFDKFDFYVEMCKRKEFILSTISSQKKLTPELQKQIEETWDKVKLEDLYLPFKPKRKTKGTMAKDMGLEPLADLVWEQKVAEGDPNLEAAKYINESLGAKNLNDIFQGVIYILGERISDMSSIRQKIRDTFMKDGVIKTEKAAKFDGKASKFDTYFDYKEKVADLIQEKGAHRYLAVARGEKEKVLSITLEVPEEDILEYIKKEIIHTPENIFLNILEEACRDAFFRLIKSSLTNEARTSIKTAADNFSIRVFAKNLKTILLSSPFGGKKVIALDPAYKTGCKTVMLSETGDFLDNVVLYPHTASDEKIKKSGEILLEWVKKYEPEAFVIGNGTASRETDAYIKEFIKEHKLDVISAVISESGASVYSASKLARDEFPKLDLTVRGAISIGRRFQDPLAELVKIDPKSVGVGQYQHDVNKVQLKKSLDEVVSDCVNFVGVDVNTASAELLSYVSGIGPSLSQNIIKYRSKKKFASRDEFLKVSRFSEKVFEQSVGFLRVVNGSDVLDNTGIHPETYKVVELICKDLGISASELVGNDKVINSIKIDKYVSDDFGPLTIKDILEELKKPGRDPRSKFEVLTFAEGVNEITDLRDGMVLNGIVTNVTNFGAFVDVGVHTDGLVHTSEIANRFISDPSEALSVGDHVKVSVLGVDLEKKQVSLSIRAALPKPEKKERPQRSERPQRPQGQGQNQNRRPRNNDNRSFNKGPRPQQGGKRNSGQQQKSLSSNPFAALANLNKK